MVYDQDNGAHSVYSLYYHFIQVIKYRKKVFTNDTVVDFLKMKTGEIAETFNVDILNIECGKDHFHMLLKATSTKHTGVSQRNKYYNIKVYTA
jgi:putative transposase